MRDILDELLDACAPHAARSAARPSSAACAALAAEPGDDRQRVLAGVPREPADPGRVGAWRGSLRLRRWRPTFSLPRSSPAPVA